MQHGKTYCGKSNCPGDCLRWHSFCIYLRFGLKIHVISSATEAAFAACGVSYILSAFGFSVIAIPALLAFRACEGLGRLVYLRYANYRERYQQRHTARDCWQALATMLAKGSLAYYTVSFGTTMVFWLGTSEIEESLLFFPEFYEDNLTGCSSAEDLPNVELDVLVYKLVR